MVKGLGLVHSNEAISSWSRQREINLSLTQDITISLQLNS